MYLDKFKNYLEAEKKYSILTVNAYTKDLEEFKDFLESTGTSLNKNIDVIITTGGTGLTGRDNTVHSVKSIAEIEIPGFGELFRQLSYQKIGTSTIQSLASAFLVNKKYIFCLPGSVSAVKDAWNDILFYQLDIRHKPCNFIELIPRLDE